ncbi:MAG: G8 domain-containing protein [Kiritimatiellae bacterium]|nr:G8 domain-containing protein [Kiritimatiellia bacterium]
MNYSCVRPWFRHNMRALCIAATLAGFLSVGHAAITWNGTSGDWSDGVKWNPAGVPGSGTEVIITNGSVRLTNTTDYLASLTISNATLIFSNWDTALTATNVIIQNGATVTHAPNTAMTTNADGSWPTYGRVYIVCTNFELQPGGTIDAAGKGFLGGGPASGYAYGPGAGGVYVDGTWGAGAKRNNIFNALNSPSRGIMVFGAAFSRKPWRLISDAELS